MDSRTTTHVIDTVALSACLRARKVARNITWCQVAEQVGITYETLMKTLRGRHTPSGNTLVSLMRWVGIADMTAFTVRRDGKPDPVPARDMARVHRSHRHGALTTVHQIMEAFHQMKEKEKETA